MAYKDFTLQKLKEKFGIYDKLVPLFDDVSIQQMSPSDWLNKTLSLTRKLVLRSEKAKSEAIVMPILVELKDRNQDFFMIHSGETLNADKEKGLNGECDFIITQNTGSLSINLPIISVVEAKRGELDTGAEQCAAQMQGALVFNEKEGNSLNVMYGCVTNGREWQFMKLEDKRLFIDIKVYPIDQLDTILGVFQHIIDYYKSILEPVTA